MKQHSPQKLSTVVSINEQFARSTRIDEDDINAMGFIYSDSIDLFLRTLIRHQSKSQQGAYTWTGPYGSGKSTLALSLTAALVGSHDERSKAVEFYNKETASRLWEAFPPNENGWQALSIIGGRGSLENLLTTELLAAGINVEREKFEGGDLQDFQKHIIAVLEEHIANNKSHGGLLIFVDEMGKLLEAAADGVGDVYFYQLLAEAASRSDGRLVFVGILHQSFQEYANSPLKRVRDEWGKIHGRFVDVTINLNSSEQIELLASSINSSGNSEKHANLSNFTCQLLAEAQKAPSAHLESLLQRCWPLNPVTCLLLGPISKRSYGQNQRSIFNFLASGEPLGFKDFLESTDADSDDFYSAAKLWDYLDVNWGSSIAVSADSHNFANAREVLSRLEALPDVKPEYLDVIKAISLLDLTSQVTGINPSHKALQFALGFSSNLVTRIVNFLAENSLIIFKKYKNAYALFEGSDFDIEAELSRKLKDAVVPKLSATCQNFISTEFVAKRHYLKSGTLRWAELKLCAPNEVDEVVSAFERGASRFSLMIIVCCEHREPFDALCEKYSDLQHIVLGWNADILDIQEFIIEYEALADLLQNSNELLKDKVARRELRDRSSAIHDIIENKINASIDVTKWNLGAQETGIPLSKIASDLADKIYYQAPVIHNELVNREKPSGSANAAMKALLYALVAHEVSKDLGMNKFPAERGLYEAILKKNKLHIANDGVYELRSPLDKKGDCDATNLVPFWTKTLDFLKSNSYRNVSLTELHSIWSMPPFGLKAGLFSLFSTLIFLTHRSQIAFYREGVFVTDFSDFDIDYIHRTPALVELRWLDMDAATRNLLVSLASIPAEINQTKVSSIEPLEVARALISTFDEIEPWTMKTNKISENAKKIRALFKRASDPAQFTLNDLPSLVDGISTNNAESLHILTQTIKDGLVELREFYPQQITRFRKHILDELGVYVESENSLNELRKRAADLKGLAGQFKLDSFTLQLSTLTHENVSFERIAANILGKPSKAWIDLDFDRLLVEAVAMCREFRNLETMSDLKGLPAKSYSFAVVDHRQHKDAEDKPIVFELTDKELSEANQIVSELGKKYTSTSEKRQLLAALAILSKQWVN